MYKVHCKPKNNNNYVSNRRLHGQMQRIISTGGSGIDKVLGDLYEDIHWILLIAGNILTLVCIIALKMILFISIILIH